MNTMNDSMAVLVNQHTVRIERLVPGPIETVWGYFTERDLLAKWLMPADIGKELGGLVEYVNPPVPMGLVEGVTAQPTSDVHSYGLINEYDPPRLLAYSWNDSTYDSASQFRIELKEQGDHVLVILIHSHLEPEWMAVTATGWHVSLLTLIALLKGEEPPETGPTFEKLLATYKVLIAGAGVVIVTTTASPALAAGMSNEAYQAIKSQKHELLVKYDSIWKDASSIEKDISQLERASERNDKALDALYRDLKIKRSDMSQIEYDIRDLDKVLASS